MSSTKQMNTFLYGGMTPRAWRMISYICIGITIYGMVLVTEALQNQRMNRIDRQMREVERLEQSP